MAIQGFCVAFNDATMTGSPTWTRLDTTYHVTGITIDRGRNYEFDRTEAGSATVTLVDINGDLDPTNAAGPYYGKLLPLKQAAIALWDPVASAWTTIFRGFISDWSYSVDATERFINVTVHLVDALDVLGSAELVPGGAFGDAVPSGSTGDVYYAADANTDAVQTRVVQVLDEVGWPGTGTSGGTLREVFTGNVKLQEMVYAFGTPALTVILDAADAEFPAVAQFFIAKDGTATFHGRYARFNPTEAQYHIHPWQVGDTAAVAADASNVKIVEPLEFITDKEHLYTVALCTPQNIDDSDIASQYRSDAASVALYGVRTWAAENLVMAGGASTTAVEECQLIANYIIQNYSTPTQTVRKLSFHAAKGTGTAAGLVWALVAGVDISDRILLKTTHVNGTGGFNEYLFVEGLHYDIRPMTATHTEVLLTVDVSPASYFSSNPFQGRALAFANAKIGIVAIH